MPAEDSAALPLFGGDLWVPCRFPRSHTCEWHGDSPTDTEDSGWHARDWTDSDDRVRGGNSQVHPKP